MDENLKQEEVKEPEVKQEEVQIDPIEERAREMGWRPKEEFEGDEVDFIDAKEFVRRQPLFDKIEHLSKELKKMKQGHEALVDHTRKLKEVEFKRAMDQLKAARKQAMLEGETDKALVYEEKLEEVEQMRTEFNEQSAQLQQNTQTETEHPTFVGWKQKNGWYGRDESLTLYADALGRKLAKAGVSPETVLDEVAKEVRKEFPHKFSNPNRNKPGAVETPTRKGSTKEVEFEMPEQDRQIMNKILRAGGLTKEEYMEQYKLIHGVK